MRTQLLPYGQLNIDLPDHENPLGVDLYNKNTAAEENLTTNFPATYDQFETLKITGWAWRTPTPSVTAIPNLIRWAKNKGAFS